MQKRKFDELISRFNRKVSDMGIDQKYKMELLGMISAIGFAHEKELGTNLAEVGTDCISRQAAIDALDEIEAEVADGYGYQYAKWREYFVELPPAQPEPAQVAKDIARIVENEQDMRVIGQERIRGRWIPVGGALYKCDQCGVVSLKRKFCSECGADMREVTT